MEYLIDSISFQDTTLQTAIGLIRANTNNMCNDFELVASTLIEVYLYCHGNKIGGNTNFTANVSAIDFSAGCGQMGVDFC